MYRTSVIGALEFEHLAEFEGFVKLLAELVASGKKEAALAQRAQDHIEASYQVIDTLFQEIDESQLVIDELEGRDIF